jgi:magnesium chelatase family protein
MALSRVASFAIDGVSSRRVTVEADIRRGLPAFTVVGLADKAVRESRERVRAAIVNSGFEFPESRLTVNLAPAYLRKVGPSFDLPLAIAILVASGQIEAQAVEGAAFAGELSLNGGVRAIRGALALAEGAHRHGLARVFVPLDRAREAALVSGVEAVGVETLVEAAAVLRGLAEPAPLPAEIEEAESDEPDLCEVRGHNGLMHAIETVAAGGHNLYMHGPPGTGKTMLARRIPGLLPPMSEAEAIDVTRIHSIAGQHSGGGLITRRPFRSPHHTISAPGLIGGGATPMPGEITLAHHGVLFLDEWSEFNRAALESLRQPLEDGRVVIVRAQRVLAFPTRCMLIAAANPCACGLGGSRCRCSAADLSRHERRLSGPLLDRMDVSITVPRPSAQAMREQAAPASAVVRERVMAARERQAQRFAGTGVTCNGQMTARMVRDLVGATPAAMALLNRYHDKSMLSARGYHRVLRLARTVADLDGSDPVLPEHIQAAVGFRSDGKRETRDEVAA